MLFMPVPLPIPVLEFIFFIAAMPIPIPMPELVEPILFAAAPMDARLFILLLVLFILPSPPKAGVDDVAVIEGRGGCVCEAPGGGARLKPEKLDVVVLVLMLGGGGREKVGVRFWVCCVC